MSERFSHLRADAGRSILALQKLIMVVVAFSDYLLDEVEMYAEGLRTFGVRVVPVIGDVAIQAANTIANTACDAVITRILPGHFGIELVRAMRADEKTAHLPVLVITSLPPPPLPEAERETGAPEVLLLPQTPEQLARAIRRLLRHRPAA